MLVWLDVTEGYSYWFGTGFTVYGLFIFLMIMSFAELLSGIKSPVDCIESFYPTNEFVTDTFVLAYVYTSVWLLSS